MTEQELAGMIWNIKEIIRGGYDDTEVENVILPFTLLRRLDCVLQDRYEELYEQYRSFPDEKKDILLQALMRRNGLTFFNTSGLSLNKLLAQPIFSTPPWLSINPDVQLCSSGIALR